MREYARGLIALSAPLGSLVPNPLRIAEQERRCSRQYMTGGSLLCVAATRPPPTAPARLEQVLGGGENRLQQALGVVAHQRILVDGQE